MEPIQNPINNQIKEALCSREICKLLDEKGFKVDTEANYWILAKDHTENYDKGLPVDESKVFFAENQDELDSIIAIDEDEYHNVYHVCHAPTHGLVNEWLRVNFGLWVAVYFINFRPRVDFTLQEHYSNQELRAKQMDINYDLLGMSFQSPQEAFDAIFKRILTEMI